jgi:PAS domain S-box-containing protein
MGELRERAGVWAYGLAVLASALAFGLRLVLQPVLLDDAPLLMFMFPVFLAAWYGGLGPGLLATVLCAAAGTFYFITPHHSFAVERNSDLVRLAIFVGQGLLISGICGALHRARRQAETGQALLAESERRFHLLAGAVREYAIFMLDPSGLVISWNSGAQNLTGYNWDRAVGRALSALLPPQDSGSDIAGEMLAKAAEQGHDERTVRWLRKNGGRSQTHIMLVAMKDPQGAVRGYTVILYAMPD